MANVKVRPYLKTLLIKKGYSTSAVWRWFGYGKSDQEQTKPVCKICRRVVPARTGNTTNLFNHLRRHHPTNYTESVTLRAQASTTPHTQPSKATTSPVSINKQQFIQSCFAAIAPYEKQSKRSKTITSAITYCLAKDMMPLNTVEKEGFRKLIKVLDPRYKLPGRKYFSRTAMPQVYDECRRKVEIHLNDIKYFATTTDLWSSRTSEPYMSLTIHFIDEEWALHSKCLQTAYFPEDHTGEIISQGLEDALKSWGLREDRQVCITTDNGANVVKAVSLKGWSRLQCFGHRLHLAIGKFMIIYIGYIKKVHDDVKDLNTYGNITFSALIIA